MKQQQMKRTLMAVLVSGMFLPLAAQAADADLLRKLEALTKEVEALKAQVQAQQVQTKQVVDRVEMTESKSIGKWLDVGGDYQFRVDSMRGETKTYTDVVGTFANAQNALQGDFFANPSTVAGSSTYFGMMGMSTSSALSALMQFSQGMSTVQTYNQAVGFTTNPMNAGLIQGIGGFASTVPSYKPKNDTMYTHRFGLDLHAKATQDLSVSARLGMYKTFGDQTLDALSNGSNAPFFADRVGVFDGTLGHVPSDSYLNVDRAYATWSQHCMTRTCGSPSVAAHRRMVPRPT